MALPTDGSVAKEIDCYGSLGLQPSRYSEMLSMIDSGKFDAMTEYNSIGIPVCDDSSS